MEERVFCVFCLFLACVVLPTRNPLRADEAVERTIRPEKNIRQKRKENILDKKRKEKNKKRKDKIIRPRALPKTEKSQKKI